MGKGGSEAEAILSQRSRRCFLPEAEAETDLGGAGLGFLCKEANHFDVEEEQGGGGGSSLKKKVMATLTDLRGILLLYFIMSSSSFSSRFICNFPGRYIHSVCYMQKNKSSNQIYIQRSVLQCRSLRLWTIISSSLLLLLLLSPSLQLNNTSVISENYSDSTLHVRSSYLRFSRQREEDEQLDHTQASTSVQITTRGSDLDQLRFQEAPSFRNGDGCPSPDDGFFVCDPLSVHIAMTLDKVYLRGSMAAVFSILQHASCPQNIVFHFLITADEEGEEKEGEKEEEEDQKRNGRIRRRSRRRKRRKSSGFLFQNLLRGSFPSLKFQVYHFDSNLVKDRISSSVRQALEQPLNYARNYLAQMMEPCVSRVIYLDSDIVVVDDIARLWSTSLGPHTIAAPEYCHANFTNYFSPSFWEDAELSRSFHGRRTCYFNTGVMVMELGRWRERNYTKRIEEWMDVQKRRRIYELGSLPPFLLVFAGSVAPVEHRWNQHGLGGDNVKGSCRPLHPGPVSLLHWSGQGKPWSRLDAGRPCPLDQLFWEPFDLLLHPSGSAL